MCLTSDGKGEAALEHIARLLLEERRKGAASFMRPLLDTLPSDVSYMPQMWSQRKRDALRGTALLNDIEAMRGAWQNGARSLAADEDEYFWVRATIQGRLWSLSRPSSFSSDGGGSSIVALVPFVSLANHNTRRHATVSLGNGVTSRSDAFVMHAEGKLYPGEPVHLNYGDLSFQQTLLSFGYMVPASQATGCFSITVLRVLGVEMEVKARMHVHGSAPALVDEREDNKREVNAALRAIEGKGLSRIDAVATLRGALMELCDGLSVLATRLGAASNGRYFFFAEDGDEPDETYVIRVELNSALALLHCLRALHP